MKKEHDPLHDQRIEEDAILKSSKEVEEFMLTHPYYNELLWGKSQFEKEMKDDDPFIKEKQALSEIRAIRGRNKTHSKKIVTEKPEPFDPNKEYEGFRGFINALERPSREAQAMMEEGLDKDETDRDYE